MADAYNSEKLRETAAQIDSLTGQLEDGCIQELSRAMLRLEPWRGRAQEACQTQLDVRRNAVASEARCLRQISKALRAYADRLDEADHQLATQL